MLLAAKVLFSVVLTVCFHPPPASNCYLSVIPSYLMRAFRWESAVLFLGGFSGTYVQWPYPGILAPA